MSPIYDPNAINDAPDDANKQPGVYHVEISTCKLASGKTSGLPRYDVELIDVEDSRRVCFDRYMLAVAPGGHPFPLTMTKAKFKVLGIPVDREATPTDFIGRRAWVRVDWGKENQDGNSYLEPKGGKDGAKFGYWPDGPECPVKIDESQAASMFGKEIEKRRPGQTVPWPAGVTDATLLPQDHPDYRPF